MKNKFSSGFWAGLASAFVVFSLLFSVYVGVIEDKTARADTVQEQPTPAQGESESGTQKENAASSAKTEFEQKLNGIRSMIDYYFWKDVDEETLYDGIYRGLLESLDDPYSTYYDKEEYKELMESTEGSYCGIGALVSQNASTRIMTIVRPFVDGPAYQAGMLPGDVIYKVDGEDVTGEELSFVVKKMKGEQGTQVTVTVIREGVEEPIDLLITRDVIEVETVTYEMLDNRIGYITIMEFDMVTLPQFKEALAALEAEGMQGLVVDIRDNPGGLLDIVCDMLDCIIPEGNLVYTLDKYGNREEINATTSDSLSIPMAVLINGNSASASEIFSGALQDYGLATIVGTQSFGKGIVQSIIPLYDGSAVKLTVSTYYTPNGRCIHGTGITPDVVVELDEGLKQKVTIEKEEDNQLQKAIEVVEELLKQK